MFGKSKLQIKISTKYLILKNERYSKIFNYLEKNYNFPLNIRIVVEVTRLNINNEVEFMEITLMPSKLYNNSREFSSNFLIMKSKLEESYNFNRLINYSFYLYNKNLKKRTSYTFREKLRK